MSANTNLNPLNKLFLKDVEKEIQKEADESFTKIEEITPKEDEPAKAVPVEPVQGDSKSVDWEKRYGDGRTEFIRFKEESDAKLSEKERRLQEIELELKTLKQAKKLEGIDEAKLAAYKQAQPDSYDMLVAIARKENIQSAEEFEGYIKTVETKLKEAEEREALQEILKEHPDAIDIRESKEFEGWYKKQTRGIQGLFADGATSVDAIEGITLYKNKMGIKPETVDTKKRKAAQTVDIKAGVEIKDNSGKVMYYESQLTKNGFYEANKDEIDKAEREGRIILDISGRRRR